MYFAMDNYDQEMHFCGLLDCFSRTLVTFTINEYHIDRFLR